MGVICGVFNMDGRPFSQDTAAIMMSKLDIYPMDTSETWHNCMGFMGCRIKYITSESKIEKLPYYDYIAGLVITADAIIDNRAELLKLLNISSDRYTYSCITDSQLILLAYKKWGESCPKYLVGDFAFAIWDIKKKELFCARDHVGKRTFYFCSLTNTFAFSTVIKPLFTVLRGTRELNDAWIADFLSLPGVAHEFDCNQTVYKNIQQLLPAHTLKIKDDKLEMKQYWSPLDTPELRLKSDKEYEEAFREIFFEAVNCRLRSAGSVGIMLSGGLDSGSIACVAAKQIIGEKKNLKAFSSVPFRDYKDWLSSYYVADESKYIETIMKEVKNIDITYCSCEGRHSFSGIEELIDMLEQPYKIIENLFWYDEIAEMASKQGCSILLDGQSGNSTVSYGEFNTHIVSLYRSGKLLTLLREIKAYSRNYNISPVEAGKDAMYSVLPYGLQKIITKVKGEKYDFMELLPVNPKLAKQYNVEERFKQEDWGIYPPKCYDLSEVRRFVSKPQAFSHVGALETKVSLAHGITKRDPTRDKRVIEFCYSIPGEQFVRDGRDRQLIRRAMKGILPDNIRLNYETRGYQGADWIQRILPVWETISMEIEQMFLDDRVRPYLDIPKLRVVMKKIENSSLERNRELVRMLLISLVFWHFLRRF